MSVPQSAAPDEAWSPEAGEPAGPPVVLDLPGYRDFVLIASGGDSVVYRARQDGLGRPVAVKVLTVEPDGAGDAVPRFQRELEITVRLGRAHPHIVTVLDTQFTAGGRPCIVMEYHELGSLHDQLRVHGPLPASAVVSAGTVVADALSYAHRQGVLHRDVKPQNILVLPTSYVLADFGLARRADAGHSVSLERFSYRHAAPQVLDGELPTVADDIYSLGSTLFTLLDGRPPFATDDAESDTALAYLRRVRTEAPRPLRSAGPPTDLLAIIDRCLAKAREDRFADAASLRDALAAVVTEVRVWSPQATRAVRAGAGTTAVPSTVVSRPMVAPLSGVAASSTVVPRPVVSPSLGGGRPVDARPAVVARPEIALPATEPPAAMVVDEAWIPDVERAGPRPLGEMTRRSRWPRIAVFAGIALLVGALAGFLAPLLREVIAPDGRAGSRPVPSFTGDLPTGGILPGVDERLAPLISGLDDRGDAIELRWTDPTGGQALFVVIQIDGPRAVPLLEVDRGETSVVVNGLDPAADRYCFQILALALADGGRGLSPMRCTGERG